MVQWGLNPLTLTYTQLLLRLFILLLLSRTDWTATKLQNLFSKIRNFSYCCILLIDVTASENPIVLKNIVSNTINVGNITVVNNNSLNKTRAYVKLHL